MSATNKKSIFQPSNKTQSTIEHFSNKKKFANKRKEKATHKRKEENHLNNEKEQSEIEPEILSSTMPPPVNYNFLPGYFPNRMELPPQRELDQLCLQKPIMPIQMCGTPEDQMLAECMYYGHMFQTSLMAVKVSKIFSIIGKITTSSTFKR